MRPQAVVMCFEIFNPNWRIRVVFYLLLVIFLKEFTINIANMRNKNQLDATYYFIVLLIGSTCFGHYYAHHQKLATIMLITTLVVSYLVCCRLVCSLDTTPA